LWGSSHVQVALALCHRKDKFLFEVIPDYLPYNRLTEVEIELWKRFYDQKKKDK